MAESLTVDSVVETLIDLDLVDFAGRLEDRCLARQGLAHLDGTRLQGPTKHPRGPRITFSGNRETNRRRGGVPRVAGSGVIAARRVTTS